MYPYIIQTIPDKAAFSDKMGERADGMQDPGKGPGAYHCDRLCQPCLHLEQLEATWICAIISARLMAGRI